LPANGKARSVPASCARVLLTQPPPRAAECHSFVPHSDVVARRPATTCGLAAGGRTLVEHGWQLAAVLDRNRDGDVTSLWPVAQKLATDARRSPAWFVNCATAWQPFQGS